jgi:hypothetical protein
MLFNEKLIESGNYFFKYLINHTRIFIKFNLHQLSISISLFKGVYLKKGIFTYSRCRDHIIIAKLKNTSTKINFFIKRILYKAECINLTFLKEPNQLLKKFLTSSVRTLYII